MQENKEDFVVPYINHDDLIGLKKLQQSQEYDCGPSEPNVRTIRTASFAGQPVIIEKYQVDQHLSKEAWNHNIAKAFSMKHPNLVSYPGICRDEGMGRRRNGLLIEHLSKGTLKNAILRDDEPLHLSSVLSITRDIFSALTYMHSQGYACWLLKASQIFLEYNQDGTYRAKVALHGLTDMPSDSAVGGRRGIDDSVRLRAFESFTKEFGRTKDSLEPGKPVSVYAAGAILWMLLARTEIYPDNSESEVVEIKRTGRSLDIPQEWPPALRELIKDCTAFVPSARPTAAQCLERIIKIEADYRDAMLNWDIKAENEKWKAIDWRNAKRPVLAEDQKNGYELYPPTLEQQREVETLYSYCPVPGGYTIEKIYAVFNPSQVKAFKDRVDILKSQAKNPALQTTPPRNEAQDIAKARQDTWRFYYQYLASIYKNHDGELGATVIPTYYWIKDQAILNLLLSHGFSIDEMFNHFRFGQGVSTSIHPPQQACGEVMTLLMNKVVVRGDVLPIVQGDPVANQRNQGNYYANFVPVTKEGEVCGPDDLAENAELVVFDKDAIKVDYVVQLRKTYQPQKANIIGDNINTFFKKERPDAARIAAVQYSLPQGELTNRLYTPAENLQGKPKTEAWFTLSNQEKVQVIGDELGNLTAIHPKSGDSITWQAHHGAISSLKFVDDRIISFCIEDGIRKWDCPVGLSQHAFTM